MPRKTPLVLLPGLLCDAALWRHQVETLVDIADIIVPDLTIEDQVGAAVRRVLGSTPEEFAVAGLSMGGYIALEIMRQAPDRVTRLALLDTSARPDTQEKIKFRQELIDLARSGQFKGVTPRLLPKLIHPEHMADAELVESILAMADRVGRDAFLRQQRLLMNRSTALTTRGLSMVERWPQSSITTSLPRGIFSAISSLSASGSGCPGGRTPPRSGNG